MVETDPSKKSILKQGFSQPIPENTGHTEPITHAFSQPEVLDSNNTTSKLNVKIDGKINRRVSFAPDVTLHRFDSVSQQRKDTSMNNDDSEQMDFTQSVSKDQREIGDESLNITQTHNEVENTQGHPDENIGDESMEFTMRQEQLTPIMIPIGSRTGDNDELIPEIDVGEKSADKKSASNDNDIYQNDEEPMELTGIVSIENINTAQKNEKENEVVRESEPMDLTQAQRATGIVVASQPMEFTQVQTSKENTEIAESQPMEFTQVQQNEPPINDKFIDSQPMEVTQLQVRSDSSKKPESSQMDFTQPIQNNNIINRDHMKVNTVATTKGPQTSTIPKSATEQRIPPPSNIPRIIRKRKRLEEPIMPVTSEIGEPQKKRNNIDEREPNVEDMEKMSPIRVPEYNDFNRESGNSPLKYSLKSFIQEIDVGFLSDLKILKQDVKPVKFPLIPPNEDSMFKAQRLYDALYNDIPVIQMNIFIIKELLSLSTQSSKSFDHLDDHIRESTNPPLLLLDYFNSDERTKETMKEQLQLIKYFAKIIARKSFSEWYLSQLKNLKNVLIENETFLEQEYQHIRNTLKEIDTVHNNIVKIKKLLTTELQSLKSDSDKDHSDEFSLNQRIRLIALKQELEKNKLSVEKYSELQEREKKISDEIILNESKLKTLRNDISSVVTQIGDIKEGDSETDNSNSSLKLLEQITGIEIIGYELTTIKVRIQDIPNGIFRINFSKDASDIITIDKSSNKLLPYVINSVVEDSKTDNSTTIIDTVCKIISKLKNRGKVLKEFEFLNSVFLTKISHNNNIQIFDYNLLLSDELVLEISIDRFIEAMISPDIHLTFTAQVAEGQSISASEIMARITAKTQKILPWFNDNRVTLIIK
ncbi:hypothetical protein C6P45_002375 [Maudiozyma exigua]|uniref:Spc7 kinetochore protein domain-containing protein n=1 Tax=Maudiozyma exigua TaxID=34358 RepID=A0A9P6WCQ6_MAUEX|nr:hypothetical protein C6P45_002375 [Kazachstania exigua]